MKQTILNKEEVILPFDNSSDCIVFDRYCDLKQIGEGGISRVFRAYDKKMDRYVALKVLKKSSKSNEKILKRFKQEISLQSKLNINGCIRIFDCGEENGFVYCVLEYIEGKSLEQIMNKEDISFDLKINILKQISIIIKDIHSYGLEHRDIKPANIILDKNNKVFLLDFGLAKAVNEKNNIYKTVCGDFLGTPAYMSPEQAVYDKKKNRYFKSDIYSLGVTAYQLFTNNLPYEIDMLKLEEMAYVINNEAPRPLKIFNSNLPDKLERIIIKTLEKIPENRPSIEEFYNVLNDISGKRVNSLSVKMLLLVIILSLCCGFILLVYLNANKKLHIKTDVKSAKVELPKDIIRVNKVSYPPVSGLASGSYDAQLKQKAEVRETGFPLEVKTSKYDIRLRMIPSGSCYRPEYSNANYQKEIKIDKPFYIGVFEITKKQWGEVMKEKSLSEIGKNVERPITNVDWKSVQTFLIKLCKDLNVPEKTYRLPTVEEWEYAALAGTTTPFYFGDDITIKEANFNSQKTYMNKLKEVGSFKPNAFGIYDTIGNVGEWCSKSSLYKPYSNDILSGVEPIISRLVKGGSWLDIKSNCMVSYGEFINENVSSSFIGFRIVREINY